PAATPAIAARFKPPASCCCVPAPAAGNTWLTYTFGAAHAAGTAPPASLEQRSRTSAAPVVADALGAAGTEHTGGSCESSREHTLPTPLLVLTTEYVNACCGTPTVPLLVTSKVRSWKSPGSMLAAILKTPETLGAVDTSRCTVPIVWPPVLANEVK